MAREDAPAFQYYPRDYLSDARVRAMTYQERGMYWDLVSQCWLEHGLPGTPTEIARILGLAPTKFVKRYWPHLQECFVLVDGRYQHRRLEKERDKQRAWFEKSSKGGRAKAAKRHRNGKTQAVPNVNQQPALQSSSSDLSLSVKNTDNGALVETSNEKTANKAAQAWIHEWWVPLYAKYRKGAKYAVTYRKEVPLVRSLLSVHDPPHLSKLAALFLNTNDDWIAGTERSLGIFSVKINLAESKLKEYETRHGRELPLPELPQAPDAVRSGADRGTGDAA